MSTTNEAKVDMNARDYHKMLWNKQAEAMQGKLRKICEELNKLKVEG